MNSINNLENQFFYALGKQDNIDELKSIKEVAKTQLDLNSSSLSLKQREFLLNIINVTNEVLLNNKIESKGKDSDEGKLYQNLLNLSNKHVTSATKKTDQAFQNDIQQKIPDFSLSRTDEFNGDLSDLQTYATMQFTLGKDAVDTLQDSLNEIHDDLTVLNTTGDGNCFYRAISTADYMLSNRRVGVKGVTEVNHQHLRRQTVERMELAGDKSRVNLHKENGVWATNPEIAHLARAQNKPILVLRYIESSGQVEGLLYNPINGDNDSGKEVDPKDLRVIAHVNGNHYDAVRTTNDSREKLVQGLLTSTSWQSSDDVGVQVIAFHQNRI